MTSDLVIKHSEIGREEEEDTEAVPVDPHRSNCSTPSSRSTSALEDMLGLLRMETRLSHNLCKGQSELESRLT